ncbi:MAG: GNAT family N-acetyltransferase [Lachnospiraceae bacterium]|nr:GNAT family N-acetyltransferase [Lachnospiraceae bacterium]
MENIIIRRSVKEDIPYINELFIQMVKTVNRRMKKEGVEPYTDLEKGFEYGYLDSFYISDDDVIFVAEDNGKVIGFISVNNHSEYDYIYLDDYCVREEYRGKGIGSKLMAMAFEFAKDKQINQILTHVENANKESIEFYKNRGFKLVEEQGHRLLIRKVINYGK